MCTLGSHFYYFLKENCNDIHSNTDFEDSNIWDGQDNLFVHIFKTQFLVCLVDFFLFMPLTMLPNCFFTKVNCILLGYC